MDKLKKYLEQHADELDMDIPGEAVWQRLRQRAIPTKNEPIIPMIWRYAAVASVIVGIIVCILRQGDNKPEKSNVAHIQKDTRNQIIPSHLSSTPVDINKTNSITVIRIGRIKPDQSLIKKSVVKKPQLISRTKPVVDSALLIVRDVEQNYARLANLQLAGLRGTPVYGESAEYFNIFKQQLIKITNDETLLKDEVSLHGLTIELLQQIININQQRLNIHKALQAEITKLNAKVKETGSASSNPSSYNLNL